VTWFRTGVKDVAKQNIYPFAPAGPLVYTFPSSRRALIILFGRFQSPNQLFTGWGRATSFDVKMTLQFYGLPTVAPAARAGRGSDPSGRVAAAPSVIPTTGAVVPASHSAPVLAVAGLVFLLVLLATAVLWLNRRGRVDAAER